MIGCDFSEPMLDLARQQGRGARRARRCASSGPTRSSSPTRTARFDAVTVGFGVRNLADLDRGVGELDPGAEAGRPAGDPRDHQPDAGRRSRPSSRLWFDRLVPLLGTLAGDRDAYTYLPESVKRFPPPEGLALIMDRAGLERDPLHGARRRDHRDPLRRPPLRRAAELRASRHPSPSVLDAAQSWLPRRMAAVERGSARSSAPGGERLAAEAAATLAAGGKRLRPMLVLVCAGPDGRRRRDARRDRGRARPHGDAGPRRRPRRGAAAAWRARRSSPAPARDDRDRGRRPALLARVRRARPSETLPRAPGRAARRRLGRACAGRARPAPRRLRRLDRRRALPATAAG